MTDPLSWREQLAAFKRHVPEEVVMGGNCLHVTCTAHPAVFALFVLRDGEAVCDMCALKRWGRNSGDG